MSNQFAQYSFVADWNDRRGRHAAVARGLRAPSHVRLARARPRRLRRARNDPMRIGRVVATQHERCPWRPSWSCSQQTRTLIAACSGVTRPSGRGGDRQPEPEDRPATRACRGIRCRHPASGPRRLRSPAPARARWSPDVTCANGTNRSSRSRGSIPGPWSATSTTHHPTTSGYAESILASRSTVPPIGP